jgi:alcohol dehydrogenase, propanol-preferring
MKAYRVVEWQRPPEVVEIPVPRPGPGEVVVKVSGNGLCHSDLVMPKMPKVFGDQLGWSMPFTLGHEVGGIVAAIGSGVQAVQEGDPVAVISAASCGACWYCLRGLDNACDHGLAGRGYGRDGGLADYVLVSSERALVRLKTLDPTIAGPLTDAGSTSYHAVKRVLPKLVPGSTAVVIGAGGLDDRDRSRSERPSSRGRLVSRSPSQPRWRRRHDNGSHSRSNKRPRGRCSDRLRGY